MGEERSFATRALSIIGFGLLACAITILAGGIWSAERDGHGAHPMRDVATCGPTEDLLGPICGHSLLVFYPWLRWPDTGLCCSDCSRCHPTRSQICRAIPG